MKVSTRLMIVLVLVLCLVTPVTALGVPKTLKGTITGYVLYPNGRSAGGVTVEVWGPRVIGLPPADWQRVTQVVTNRNGKYSIAVPPGTYRVWFVPQDLESYCMEAYPDAPTPYNGDDVVVRAGLQTSRVSVQLDGNPSFIEGTALDVSLDPPLPLDGMRIVLSLQGYALINGVHSVYTNENGYYRIGGLKPFDWGVAANGMTDTEPTVYPEYGTLFGGLYDWSIDTPGTVEALDFDFQAPGFVNLCGRLVYDGTESPVVGATVWYMTQEDDGYFYGDVTTVTDSNGDFEFADVPAGSPPNYVRYAVLMAYGNGIQDEFYDNAHNDQEAQWLGIQRGVTNDIGNWEVAPMYGP